MSPNQGDPTPEAAKQRLAAITAAAIAADAGKLDDAVAHLDAALKRWPDDADLLKARADLAPPTDEAPTQPPETPPAAQEPPAAVPAAESVAEPEAKPIVALPDYKGDSGWPNDWSQYRHRSTYRAKRMDVAFETPEGLKGVAGDYIVVAIDEHGDAVGVKIIPELDFVKVFDPIP